MDGDIALKLRVANGTHTAVAHVMALSSLLLTDVLSSDAKQHQNEGSILRNYLDAFFESQILPGAADTYGLQETKCVYDDWRRRLCHAHFGLSSFFITQNGDAKAGLRIAPTIQSLIKNDKVRKSILTNNVSYIQSLLLFFDWSPNTRKNDYKTHVVSFLFLFSNISNFQFQSL